jgi:hypothetical protein
MSDPLPSDKRATTWELRWVTFTGQPIFVTFSERAPAQAIIDAGFQASLHRRCGDVSAPVDARRK